VLVRAGRARRIADHCLTYGFRFSPDFSEFPSTFGNLQILFTVRCLPNKTNHFNFNLLRPEEKFGNCFHKQKIQKYSCIGKSQKADPKTKIKMKNEDISRSPYSISSVQY
jgi:hypothetical protein